MPTATSELSPLLGRDHVLLGPSHFPKRQKAVQPKLSRPSPALSPSLSPRQSLPLLTRQSFSARHDARHSVPESPPLRTALNARQSVPGASPLHTARSSLARLSAVVFSPRPSRVQRVVMAKEEKVNEGTHTRPLGALALSALIFFNVSGGAYGAEELVHAAGPFPTMVGCVLAPLFFCVPAALMTAELSSAYPEDGGYVVWALDCFGPFWSFQLGWWNWTSGVVDNALYPVMLVQYSTLVLAPALGWFVRVGLCVLLTSVNLLGVDMVGRCAIVLMLLVSLPFVVLAVIQLPKAQPRTWLRTNTKVNWVKFLNMLVWNYGSFDEISTVAGQAKDTKHALPLALLCGGLLVTMSMFVPLMISTAAEPRALDPSYQWRNWEDGYFSSIAKREGGHWLLIVMQIGAALSCAAQFSAELTADSYQLYGQAKRGIIPAYLSRTCRGVPVVAILHSFVVMLLLLTLDLDILVQLENGVLSASMLLEATALLTLRVTRPNLVRPFKIPIDNVFLLALLLSPMALLCVLSFVFSHNKAKFMTVAAMLIGLVFYYVSEMLRESGWVKFNTLSAVVVCPETPDESQHTPHTQNTDEAD